MAFGNVNIHGANTMTGASASSAGKEGLVPAPAKGKQTSFLRGDGSWQIPPDTTYSEASQSAAGLMSANDKKKLDNVAEGANAYTHPTHEAKIGVPKANQTPNFGDTFSVTQPVSDTSGHITDMNSRTVKIPNTVASQSAAGLMSAHDKTWLDGKCKRYVYGADSSATDNYGFYKIASITTATTNRTYAIKLRIASDNFVNYPKPPADITIVFRTNSTSATTTNVYVYADSIKSPILDDIYIKYPNNTNTGTCEIYFRKTAAYQKITVDVLGEWQRGSTASTANYQSVWTFSENNIVSASISETGYIYSEASALASGATKAKVFKFSYTTSDVRFTVTIRQVVDSNNNFISCQAYVYTYQDNVGGKANHVFEMTDEQKKAFVCNGVGTQWSGVGFEAHYEPNMSGSSSELLFSTNYGHLIYINDGKVNLNLLRRAAGTHTEQSALTLTPFVDDLSPTAYASLATEPTALMSVNIADTNRAEGVSSTDSVDETEVEKINYIDSNDIEFQYYEIF